MKTEPRTAGAQKRYGAEKNHAGQGLILWIHRKFKTPEITPPRIGKMSSGTHGLALEHFPRNARFPGLCERKHAMLKWALIFLVISIVAGFLGFSGVSAATATIAKVLFFLALFIFVIFLVLALMAGSLAF